ncbi:MAG: GNAT family N-acetyltransferase [Lachnospiraceae bacterium]
MELYLRGANASDKKKIFEWANEAENRRNSFQQNPIPWEDHEVWFDKVLASEDTLLFVGMDFMKPVGTVRIHKTEDGIGEISYSVDADCRNQGIGKKLLFLLEKELLKETGNHPKAPVRKLVGKVKKENVASCHVFEHLGYHLQESNAVQSSNADQEGNDSLPYGNDCQETDFLCYEKELPSSMKEWKQSRNILPVSKSRQANFEILRCLAMMMILVLHYLSKGGLLEQTLGQNHSLNNILRWTLEAFCLASVNVYVFISGYFLIDRKFQLSRFVRLWCEVFFYSVGIVLVCIATQMVNVRELLNLHELLFYFFPVVNGHYWFATAYLLLLLFVPFMGSGIRKLGQKQHACLLWLLLILFSFSKTLIPFSLGIDDRGNGVIWFLCLYVLASYIRLYGLSVIATKGKSIAIYLCSVALIVFSMAFYTGSFMADYPDAATIPTGYNFVFVLTASLGLFGFFQNLSCKDNVFTRFFVRIAPYTFGVYLIHEHLLLRYAWPQWFRVSGDYGMLRILHLILSVLVLFCGGIVIDFLRELFFRGIEALMEIGLRIYYKKQEVWDYLIFGGLTTLVNWVAYLLASRAFLVNFLADDINKKVSNVIAWVVAVIFAYWTNRKFVFHSEVVDGKGVAKEFFSFVGARVFSFLVEQFLFMLMLDLLHSNDLVAKLVIGIVVIILNYIFSKLWIFQKKK